MKKIILLWFICLLILNTKGQTYKWSKSFGGPNYDIGKSIVIDKSKNVYCTGTFETSADLDPSLAVNQVISNGNWDIFISKFDSSGQFIWGKSIGGIGLDRVFSIACDSQNNIYITGGFHGTVDFDPNFSVSNITTIGVEDIFVAKYDSNSNLIWIKHVGEFGHGGVGTSIIVDNSNHLLITGIFGVNIDFDPGPNIDLLTANASDIFVWKLDLNGNHVWAKNMGGPNDDEGESISVDSFGNIYTTGLFRFTADFNPSSNIDTLVAGNEAIFVSKLDSNGNYIWAKGFAYSGANIGFGISNDKNGNVLVTGQFVGTVDFDPSSNAFPLTSNGNSDIFIIKLDPNGNLKWVYNFGGTSSDFGAKIAIDSLCNVYTTGSFSGSIDFDPNLGIYNLVSLNSSSIFISKLDSNGNFISAKKIGGNTSSDFGYANDIKIDDKLNIYLTGQFSGTINFNIPNNANLTANGFYEAFISKYSQCNTTIVNDTILTCNSIYNWQGNSYSTSGIYYDTITSCCSCDTIMTLNLTINSPSYTSIFDTSCSFLLFNGLSLTNSGVYYDTLINSLGCDSIITLNLIINNTTSNSIFQTSCNSYLFNNQMCTASGVYYDTILNSNGCDSLITLNLTINSINNSVTQNSPTLNANEIGASYQWLQCPTYSIITGATNQTYTATSNGDYAVSITKNNCTDTSNCITVNNVGINNMNTVSDIFISPNPTNGIINIVSNFQNINSEIKIMNSTGQRVFTTQLKNVNTAIDISTIANGIYYIEIKAEYKTYRTKLVKN